MLPPARTVKYYNSLENGWFYILTHIFLPLKKIFEKNCKKHLHFFSGRATILMVMVRWSSGQDAALSRRKHGFDSRTDCYQKSPAFWVEMPEALKNQCVPAFFVQTFA